MTPPILNIEELTRRYGGLVANDRVSLSVAPGEVVGLLGHNGAGKTTLVSQIVGLLKPDSGRIDLAGTDAVARPAEARRLVAIQPQSQAPVDGLTPKLAIELSARLRGLSPEDARRRARQLAEELDLMEWFERRALPEGGGLSGGVRRLVGFAMALAGRTPLVVLDEPTNDIDASRRRLLWDAVRRRADEGAGMLVVTHNVAEVERVVDDLVILHHGRVVGHGTPAQLRGREERLILELQCADATSAREFAPSIPTRHRVDVGHRVLLHIGSADAAAAIAWADRLRGSGGIEGYSLSPMTLEDIYIELTHEDAESGQEAVNV